MKVIVSYIHLYIVICFFTITSLHNTNGPDGLGQPQIPKGVNGIDGGKNGNMP